MSETKKKVSFWRIFWPSLTAAALVSIIGTLIWVMIIGSLFEDVPFRVKNKTVLHMTLDGKIKEVGDEKLDPFSMTVEKNIGLASILNGLKTAEKDKNIKGIFLELKNMDCGWSTAREIRNAINAFERSGKFVIAYNSGEVVTTKEYYISSAADKNYGFETSIMQFLGLGTERMYFKGLFDKLGVEMQVIRGSDNDFKSAVEPFFRENMSDSARLQTDRYLQSLWKDIRQDIARDRGMTIERLDWLAEHAKITKVRHAVKYKLMDGSKYRDEIISMIHKKLQLEKGKDIEFLSFAKYARKKFQKDQKRFHDTEIGPAIDQPNIAVILAEGEISVNGDGMTSEEICKHFIKARNDKSVKAVVFRINSPGGSALASDEIWREVKLTNAKKPVIVSMGDVAASGGYFVAAPATSIFAEPTTITGSIGVFGFIPYTGDMMKDKLGITFDRVSTNSNSTLSTNQRLTEEQMTIIQNEVNDTYADFKEKVAQGRGLSIEKVNRIARGRVWTGRDAMRIGLVDQLGGLKDAINFAAKKVGIKNKKIMYYPLVKADVVSELLEQFDEETTSAKVKRAELPEELILYYEQLKTIESIRGIQMRIPYFYTIY